jgi:hypothetical protein
MEDLSSSGFKTQSSPAKALMSSVNAVWTVAEFYRHSACQRPRNFVLISNGVLLGMALASSRFVSIRIDE